jgi:phytanoyl-CoA hydroxylase
MSLGIERERLNGTLLLLTSLLLFIPRRATDQCRESDIARSFIDVDFFKREGYLVIKQFANVTEIESLQAAATAIIDAWELPSASTLLSSVALRTPNGSEDSSFLLGSATEAKVFPEISAVDLETERVLWNTPKRHIVRKIGHGLHMAKSNAFRSFVRSSKLKDVAVALGWQTPVVTQTVYRVMAPFSAGVDRHQDATFLLTEPETCLGLLVAMEEVDERNGCPHVRPGSHNEPLRERFFRSESDSGIKLSFKNHSDDTLGRVNMSSFVAIAMEPGDLLVFHGLLDHFSAQSQDPTRSRESFQIHIAEAAARWSDDNWLQYPQGQHFLPLGPA